MCGITGIFKYGGGPVERGRVEEMTRTLVHRGPDDSGFFFDGPLGMGMRRLSIIDIAGGRQPIFNEDKTIAAVFNGEIYNYRELRRDLESNGHIFRTDSDSEVIVHLYEEQGEEFPHKLNGMFAIALWNSAEGTLLLVRDRLGIKPLYYAEAGGELLFGSEIKALTGAAPALRGEIDSRALDWYLTTQYFPLDRTLLKGVRKLLPGHMMQVRKTGTSISQYWRVRFPSEKLRIGEDEVVERFRQLFTDAVGRRMIADVPLGAFLSGGIDSSAVVAVMSSLTDEPVRTFSIGFGEEARSFNELGYAGETARHCGAESHTWVIKPGDVRSRLERVLEHFDEPFGSGLHTYLVSELAAKEVKVALSGIGADELLFGYERQKKARFVQAYSGLPAAAKSVLKRGVSAVSGAPGARRLAEKFDKLDRLATSSNRGIYFDWISVFNDALKRDVYTDAYYRESVEQPVHDYVFGAFGDDVPEEFDDLISYLELKTTLPDDFLNYTDRMSMAWSLEARTPFLDHELVEFAAALPADMKLRNGETKFPLKKAMHGLLPGEIIYRRKQPFFLPLGIWFRGELRPFVEEQLAGGGLSCGEYIDPAGAAKLAKSHLEGRADYTWQLWSLILVEQWFRRNL